MPLPISQETLQRMMVAAIDKRVAPDKTLTGLLFPESLKEICLSEYAQVDVKTGGFSMAPFVKKGQQSVMVPGTSGSSYMIETPYVNIMRPMQYTADLFARQFGGGVFVNSNTYSDTIAMKMIEDLDIITNMLDSRIEWLVAMLLRGTVNYTNDDGDSWTIDTGKPDANTITAATLWDGDSPDIYTDINSVLKVINAANGPSPNIAIGGAEATAALLALISTGAIKPIATDSGVAAGDAALASTIGRDRLQYLGRFGAGAGIAFYGYSGTYLADTTDGTTGAATDLIQTEYFEFFNTNATKQERTMFYGRIPSLLAVQEGRDMTDRLIDVIGPTQDNDSLRSKLQSRPLPWFYYPEWNVSLKVT